MALSKKKIPNIYTISAYLLICQLNDLAEIHSCTWMYANIICKTYIYTKLYAQITHIKIHI